MPNNVRERIVDLMGGSSNISWNDIIAEYAGMTRDAILDALNYMWPHDDNGDLADDIENELRYE